MQIYEIGLVVNRIVGGLSAWLLLVALSGTLLSELFGAPAANRL
jgi:hypothetical protein